MQTKTLFTATLSALALGLALSTAQAQQGYSSQGGYQEGDSSQGGYQQGGYQGGNPAQAPQLDDETLGNFAQAYKEVGQIRDAFSEQLQGVNDADKARNLQEKAQEQMIQAVIDSGLTVPEYNQVVTAMDSDPELRERIMGMM